MRWPRGGKLFGRGSSPVIVTLLACVVTLQFLLLTRQHPVKDGKMERVHSQTDMKEVREERMEPVKECSCGSTIVPGTTPDPNPLLFPVPKRDKAFLTIGIPAIKREGASYYAETIKSMTSNMSPEEQKEVLIVVFLADTDPTVKAELSGDIRRNFSDAIDAGMLHVIQAPSGYYPNLTITKFTYGQEKHYIQWRAKQNFDYAFMFEYSLDISKYYMQIEDDVITVDGYIGAIKQYIEEQPDKTWTCLEFSELGFIGKLYKNSDLQKLAALLKLFYEEQPVDYTYLYFNMLNTQMVQRLRKPTLFQHKGIHSSYPGKIQPLKDSFFDQMTKQYKADNPPAEVFTSMEAYLTFLPRLAYEKTEGCFLTHRSPSDGDSFTVVFQEPHRLRRVIIDTGSVGHPEDILLSGHLEVSLTLLKTEVNIQCVNDIMIGEFKDGRIDVDALEEIIKFKAMCLKVRITKHQEPWLIVREIAVFTAS
ncbi:alpha-1,3-mannosyl-glycoprotein 4-beta-N-acetylglucosaminyltransferase C-like [Haliotis rufescens]|uniref:alpha-1,3-mannosyl-glycoprotein 4-beta-N-acetylglucosaminyltransferase C-like n=1 Tax=Haliotis rufescens TaxID=6454 RepID=UPI00201F68A9|nr:alpha-1,3-mannosyl-glycoprotein 4-beta-N-acetylglucosaminyltransferase C-like [Haliotis rufescens]